MEIDEVTDHVAYKPCVDITFNSIANSDKKPVLTIVLTGMGNDGCSGASLLKQKDATIWVQGEQSSVVYVMLMAIAKANLTDKILLLEFNWPETCGFKLS